MQPRLVGWPSDGPTLRLDYRRFSYAGKFVMSTTGKAVIRSAEKGQSGEDEGIEFDDNDGNEFDDDVLAAVAFSPDRTDPEILWIRYVTVREDCRGGGLGPQLCLFLADRAAGRGYERLQIAVNNPFAYEALYRAGFEFSGRETGLAELVLSRPVAAPREERSRQTYQAGLDRYRERDLSPAEEAFLDRKFGTDPPEPQSQRY